MELSDIRLELNKIDTEIVELISKRQSFMPAVGAYKKEHNLPIYQPEREVEILKVQKELALKAGADPGLIEKIFLLIFDNSRHLQEK